MKKKTQSSNSTSTNLNQQIKPSSPMNSNSQYFTFPIWEKVYLDIKEVKDIDSFFSFSSSVFINKKVYIFPKYKSPSSHYAIFDTSNEQIAFYPLQIECFNPLHDKQTNLIYLFSYDSSYGSDFRYNIIEYNPINNSFTNLVMKGVAPKARREAFTSFIFDGKIYFFGGVQMFTGDNSMNYLFSFNIKECEWNIEKYNGIFHNDNMNLGYIINTFNVIGVEVEEGSGEEKGKVILIGGKYFDDVFYSNMSITTKIQNAKESSEIVEFTIDPIPTFTLLSSNDNIKFSNHSIYLHNNIIYIHNKGNLYTFDPSSNELSMLKPRIFSPESQTNSSLFIANNFIYVLGKFKCYEDCYVFKTSYENINVKWNFDKLISYENLLNVKECSDMVCSFNNGDKSKEVYLNKKILYNFSLALKKLIINWSQNSNVYIFNDINYITMYNILKFIYSNFNEDISSIEHEILSEIFYVLLRYRAKSLLNIIIDHIVITNEKAVKLYELALKHNLPDFLKKCEKYISENINSGLVLNESSELKTILYENYFCEHKIYIQCNIAGIDIKNVSQMTMTNDKVNEIKELSKDGKLMFCLNCKKVFKSNN